ncbi:MAG: thioredoxin family protein [Mangrovibacterium sp.]
MKQFALILGIGLLSLLSCSAEPKNTKNEIVEGDSKAVNLIGKQQFLTEVWNYEQSPDEWKFLGKKPVIIDFYADWCGPCKIAGSILEEVANEYAGQITVYKIDTQRERELASVFGIQSIPAFLYIPVDGKPVMTAGIGRTKEQTKQLFVDNINTYLLKK